MCKVLYVFVGFLLVFSVLKVDDFLEEVNEIVLAYLNYFM